jgi:DHA2 family multidrug resistance protein
LVSTLVLRRAQVHQALMVAHLTPFDPVYTQHLAGLTRALSAESGIVAAHQQAQGLIYNVLGNQARLWAFVENFRLFGVFCICCLPLVLLFKKVKKGAKAGVMH